MSKRLTVLVGLMGVALFAVLLAMGNSSAVKAAPAAQTACEPAWQSSAVYVADDYVSHNGKNWRAKWWTQNEEPGTTGQWGVWEDNGACGGGTPNPTSTPNPTATSAPPTATSAGPTATSVPPTATSPSGSCTAPQYVDGSSYSTNDIVQNNGHEYQCTVGGWCSVGGPYEPGVGWAWENAWNDLGACTGGTPLPTPTGGAPTNTPVATTTPAPTNTPVGPTSTPAGPTPTATPRPTVVPPTGGKEVIGYFTQWGIYGRNFVVKDIVDNGSAEKLTIINYAFANIVDGECIMTTQTGVMDAYADYQKSFSAAQSVDGVGDVWSQDLKGNFNPLKELKQEYPHIRVLISLGGWTWSKGFHDAVQTEASRQQMVESCIDIYIHGNLPVADGAGGPGAAAGVFDGIDIDWEYPNNPGDTGTPYGPEDTENFTLMLAEFREQLDAIDPNLMLTVATGAGIDKYDDLELDKIGDYLDYVNIMAYDYHGGWESETNHQAALYGDPNDPSPYPVSEYNTHSAVQGYIAGGVPAEKIIIGVPFYGRGWTGVTNANDGLYQSASNPAPATWEAGVEDYKVLKTLNYPKFRDPVTKTMWIYDGNTFWSYDDEVVIADKMNYINQYGLAGAMVWSLDGDDANGTLITAVADGLNP